MMSSTKTETYKTTSIMLHFDNRYGIQWVNNVFFFHVGLKNTHSYNFNNLTRVGFQRPERLGKKKQLVTQKLGIIFNE